MFFRSGIDTGIAFEEGKEQPIRLFPDIQKADSDQVGAQETYGALNSKVALDILNYSFNTMDIIVILMMISVLIMSFVELYYLYQISTGLTGLLGYLQRHFGQSIFA